MADYGADWDFWSIIWPPASTGVVAPTAEDCIWWRFASHGNDYEADPKPMTFFNDAGQVKKMIHAVVSASQQPLSQDGVNISVVG